LDEEYQDIPFCGICSISDNIVFIPYYAQFIIIINREGKVKKIGASVQSVDKYHFLLNNPWEPNVILFNSSHQQIEKIDLVTGGKKAYDVSVDDSLRIQMVSDKKNYDKSLSVSESYVNIDEFIQMQSNIIERWYDTGTLSGTKIKQYMIESD
jgi:hypothetical protein